MGENAFPRGGSKNTLSASKRKFDASEDLFRASNEQKPSKRKRSKKSKGGQKNEDEVQEVTVIEQLSSSKITEGLIVLSCVYEVHQYNVLFSLPSGIIASMPITNMHDNYVKLLQQFSENPESFSEELLPLTDIFKVGNCYPVKVTGISQIEGSSVRRITISLNPKIIYEDLSSSSIYHGMVLLGAVISIEDHGYIIDVGIKGLTGFLSKKESQNRNIKVNQLIHVAVNMPELDENPLKSRSLLLTMKAKILENKPEGYDNISLQNIYPAVYLPAEIVKVANNGLAVTCLGYNGCIWKDNLKGSLQSSEGFKVGQDVVAMVLFKNPITQVIHMSLGIKPSAKNIVSRFGDLKEGDLIRDAEIIEVASSGIYLNLSEKHKAFARSYQLSDRDISNVADAFQIGEKKKCRILGFNYLDGLVKVTLKKSLVKKSPVIDKNLKVGDVINGTIQMHCRNGMLVALSNHIQGFVRDIHMSDVPLNHPEKMYPLGSAVTCRILQLDSEGRASHLLTCKKSLVNSKIAPLTTFDDPIEGFVFEGFVLQASPKGLLIGFYNNIAGWVAPSEISDERIDHPEKVFYHGQVVKCKVLKADPIEKKLKLTMKLATRTPFGQKDMGKDYGISVGSIVSVKTVSKDEKGFDVVILPDGPKAYLPIMHLSDYPYTCGLIFEALSNDCTLNVVVFSTKGTLIVSMKQLLLESAKEGICINSFNDLEPDQILPGVIKGFLDCGVLVEVGNNITGLIHKSKLTNEFLQSDPVTIGYVTQQSLMLKILNVNPEKNRLELSSRIIDVTSNNLKMQGINHLESFLNDLSFLKNHLMSDCKNLDIGDVVSVTIEKTSKEYVTCALIGTNIKGVIKNINVIDTEFKVGKKAQAVVIRLDFVENSVELVLWPALSKKIKTKTLEVMQNKLTSESQGRIVAVTDHFALCLTTTESCFGNFVYLPIRKHPNDLKKLQYKTGSTVTVRIHIKKPHFSLGTVISDNSNQFSLMKEQRGKTFKKQTTVTGLLAFGENNLNEEIKESVDGKKERKRQLEEDSVSNLVNDELEVKKKKCDDDKQSLNVGDILEAVIGAVYTKKIHVTRDSKFIGILRKNEYFHSKGLKAGSTVRVQVISMGPRGANLHLIRDPHPSKVKLVLGSDKNTEINEKTNNLNIFSIGQTLCGIVSHFNDKKIFVKINDSTFGEIEKKSLKKEQCLKLGENVEVTVISTDPHRLKFISILTTKSNEVTEVLQSIFSIGQMLCGIVSHFNDKKIFVKLDDNTFGEIEKKSLQKEQCLKLGENVEVKVTSTDNHRLKLIPLLTTKSDEVTEELQGIFNIGQTLSGIVSHFNDKKIFVKLNDNTFGEIEKKSLKKEQYLKLGEEVEATVISTDPLRLKCISHLMTESNSLTKTLQGAVKNTFQIGQKLFGKVSHSDEKRIFLELDKNILGTLKTKDCNGRDFKPGEKLKVRVKAHGTDGPELCLLNDITQKKSAVGNKEKSAEREYKIGEMLYGEVSHFQNNNAFCKLDGNSYGIIKKENFKEDLLLGSKVKVLVDEIKNGQPILQLQKCYSVSPQLQDQNDQLTQYETVNEAKSQTRSKFDVGEKLDGEVSHFNKDYFFVKVKDKTYGLLDKKSCMSLKLGTKIEVSVAKFDTDLYLDLLKVSEAPSDLCEEEKPQRPNFTKRSILENDVLIGVVQKHTFSTIIVELGRFTKGYINKKDMKGEDLPVGTKIRVIVSRIQKLPDDKGSRIHLDFVENLGTLYDGEKLITDHYHVPITDESTQIAANCQNNESGTPRLNLNEPFLWDLEAASRLKEIDQRNDDNEMSEDTDDDSNADASENRMKTKMSRETRRKEQEDKIRKQEERLMDLDREPETVDDFERLLMASPDNSAIWMKYMAFQLHQAEIEKARSIAERALKTISFREEREKLNIWVALLNLENMYGTQDSLNGVFQRALQFNEPINVYRHMVNIYINSNKNLEADQIFQTMLKKFRQDPSVWLDFGVFYFKSQQEDSARKLMDRSLLSLEKKHHVDIISKFAQLEFKFGDAERAKTLFKNLLNTFPKRIDLWSVLIDSLIKLKDVDAARQALDRLASMNLQAKKMKFVFKKYLDFEKDFGTSENIEKVRLRALEYVKGTDENNL